MSPQSFSGQNSKFPHTCLREIRCFVPVRGDVGERAWRDKMLRVRADCNQRFNDINSFFLVCFCFCFVFCRFVLLGGGGGGRVAFYFKSYKPQRTPRIPSAQAYFTMSSDHWVVMTVKLFLMPEARNQIKLKCLGNYVVTSKLCACFIDSWNKVKRNKPVQLDLVFSFYNFLLYSTVRFLIVLPRRSF